MLPLSTRTQCFYGMTREGPLTQKSSAQYQRDSLFARDADLMRTSAYVETPLSNGAFGAISSRHQTAPLFGDDGTLAFIKLFSIHVVAFFLSSWRNRALRWINGKQAPIFDEYQLGLKLGGYALPSLLKETQQFLKIASSLEECCS